MLLDQIGNLEQVAGALMRPHLRPRALFECLARRLDGLVDVGLVALGNQRENFLGGRVERLEGLAGFGRDPFAADQ